MIKWALYLVVLLALPCLGLAQENTISGTVTDSHTGEQMAFVNILVNEGRFGGTTDIDGKFSISIHEPILSLKFSYVGYESLVVEVRDDIIKLLLSMTRKSITLSEVVVLPGENPAHRIIRMALKNRDRNNPMKLPSFSYTAYDKMVFTLDTTHVEATRPAPDTTNKIKDLKGFIEQRNFFLMETVTERKFLYPAQSHEKILATRISGLQDPIMVFLLSQLQSTGFYDELIRISDKNYVNPISEGSVNKYLFILEETTPLNESDTLFTISFRPFLRTNFDGLQGVLTIHSDGFAIQNVQAKPYRDEKGFSISIRQMYEKIDGKHWFPVQLHTDISFDQATLSDGNVSYPLLATGKSYLRDIVLNPELVRQQFNHIAIEVSADASRQDEAWWHAYRSDSLSLRDMETYRYLDSLGRAARLDMLANTMESLISGQLPIGMFSLNLNKLLGYNDFEGFYAGLGLLTNQHFSRHLVLGGFWGYGFGDKRTKYGLNLSIKPNPQKSMSIDAEYYDKSTETGGVSFGEDSQNSLSAENFRLFYIDRMDYTKGYMARISFRALEHFKWSIGMGSDQKTSGYDYFYGESLNTNKLRQTFTYSEIRLGVRFAFREKFLQTPRSLLSLGTRFPVVQVSFNRGISGFAGGDFNYNKIDIRLEQGFYTKYLGRTQLRFQAGLIDGDVPYQILYNSPASWRTFAIHAPWSFATMRMNEFVSDRYLNIHLHHDFGKLLFRRDKFEPTLSFETNMAFGSLKKTGKHHLVQLRAPENGFYESGFLMNNLINMPLMHLGIGVFYRYGPYGFETLSDNLGYKLSIHLGM